MNWQSIVSLIIVCVPLGLTGFLGSKNLAGLFGGEPTPKRQSLFGALLSLALIAVLLGNAASQPQPFSFCWTRCAILVFGSGSIAAALGYFFPDR